jgi:oxygen-independent coproporphyrinogen-3 oxidase
MVDDVLWLRAYESEIESFAEVLRSKYIGSIFFGGGTPSLMSPKIVSGVIDKIASLALVDNNTEITLEANPSSFEVDKFCSFKLSGVNRISIGVQSLISSGLASLGRKHGVDEAIYAVEAASKIFSNVSFDLIYARSDQTIDEWKRELSIAMRFGVSHISLYQLTIEKGTEFYKLFHNGGLKIPDDDLAADMYEWTNQFLHSYGYHRYEISNYAKLGYECKHNLNYWRYNSYLGVGPGAHSRIFKNTIVTSCMMLHKPAKWLESVQQNGQGVQARVKLSLKDVVFEFLMMNLRLVGGVDVQNFFLLTGFNLMSFLNVDILDDFSRYGLLEYSARSLRLTNKGLMIHSYVIPRLLT